MKKIFINTLAFVAILFACTGCEKKTERVADFAPPGSDQAFLKVNYASAYQKSSSVQLKINDIRVSNPFTYAYPFPGGGLNTQGSSDPTYFAVAPGKVGISISYPKLNSNVDSLVLYSGTVNLEANKHYTFHIADTAANTQGILMNEDFVAPDADGSKYRFVNLMPNLPALDLYFGSTLVAANVPYKGSSPYFTLLRTTTPSQWAIRPAGAAATSTPLTTYTVAPATYSIPYQRELTVFARGYSTITGTTDVRRAQISLYYVR
ncbi:MAG: DUF4397 domain-containing protein [Niastella sp.]|uniref:DUF4397 domain-containing protein n=1 Tax=Niastella sp. TaxID=1869183 RepID=UPI00389A24C6